METTILHTKARFPRFHFYQYGHKCGIRPRYGDNRLFACGCAVTYNRITSYWYYPVYFAGKKINDLLYVHPHPLGLRGKIYSFIKYKVIN